MSTGSRALWVDASAETGALLPEGKNGGSDVDVVVLLDKAVEVRLPRMAADGTLSMRRPKKATGSVKKGQGCCAQMSRSLQKQLPELGLSSSAGACTNIDPLALLKKYGPDLLIQAVYIGGLAVVGAYAAKQKEEIQPPQWSATATYHAEAATGEITSFGSLKQKVNDIFGGDTEEKRNVWLDNAEGLWVIVAGAVSASIVLIKSGFTVAQILWGYMESLTNQAQAALDVLKAEMTQDLKALLKGDAGGDASVLGDWTLDATAAAVALPIGRGIDQAKAQLKLQELLPCPIASRCNFVITFFGPLVLFTVVRAALDVHALVTESDEPAPVPVTPLPIPGLGNFTGGNFDGSDGRRLAEDSVSGAWLEKHKDLVINVLLNTLWSLLQSWPVVCVFVNNTCRMVERVLDDFALEITIESLGGSKGLDRLQWTLDELASPGLGRSCDIPERCAIQ